MQRDNISVLVVGLGSIGRRHLRNLAALGIKRLSVVTDATSGPAGNDLPGFIKEDSLESALTRQPEAVVIASPTACHIDAALKAAETGAYLFIEKPVSHSMDGTAQLLKTVEEQELIAQVGFQFRFHPVLIEIKHLIADGKIGKVISAHSHWGEYLPDWHPWEDYRNGYSARQDLGGGAVLTLSHPYDYLRWLIGEFTSVYAIADKLSQLEVDTEDTALVSARFENGAVASIYLDYIERPAHHELKIIGEAGKICWDSVTANAKVYSSNQKSPQLILPKNTFERNTMYHNEMAHFVDCILTKSQPVCNLKDGIRALEVALAIKESASQKREIRLQGVPWP